MTRIFARPMLSLLVAASLLVVALLLHRRLDDRLSRDWTGLVEQARDEGLVLTGRRATHLFSAGLTIADVTLSDRMGAVIAATGSLRLSRGVAGVGQLTIGVPEPVTVFAGLRLWASGLTFVHAADGALVLQASDLHLARRGGPDDVLSIGAMQGHADNGHLSLSARDVILPLHPLMRADRTIAHASLDLTARSRSRALTIDRFDADWNGVTAAAAGTMSRNGSGTLDGRLAITLGDRWRDAVARLVAAHQLTASEATATRAVLDLFNSPATLRDLPLAVDHGTVSFGGLPIMRLPPM